MKHLILGSAGQIGQALCTYLKSQGEEVFEWDIKNDLHQDLRDISSPELTNKIIECDFVYFLAYDVGGAKYLEKYQDTYQFIDNNMRIMSNTFDLIRHYGKPFIFASSQMSELSHSSYGILKKLGEKMTHDIGGTVVRFWNVYDKETDPEKSHVITDFIKMAKDQGYIKMRTDGSESRQFLHGQDAAEAMFTISKLKDKSKTYDITSFKWYTIKQVANLVSEQFGNIPIVPGHTKDKTQLNAMNEASKDILQIWSPKIELKEGIKLLSI